MKSNVSETHSSTERLRKTTSVSAAASEVEGSLEYSDQSMRRGTTRPMGSGSSRGARGVTDDEGDGAITVVLGRGAIFRIAHGRLVAAPPAETDAPTVASPCFGVGARTPYTPSEEHGTLYAWVVCHSMQPNRIRALQETEGFVVSMATSFSSSTCWLRRPRQRGRLLRQWPRHPGVLEGQDLECDFVWTTCNVHRTDEMLRLQDEHDWVLREPVHPHEATHWLARLRRPTSLVYL